MAGFLAALVLLDSYKLVRPRAIAAVVVAGAAVAAVSYGLADVILRFVSLEAATYTRYVAPVVEELLKGAVILLLIGWHRIGFLVDAAIFGFAVGTGFAVAENLHYLRVAGDAGMGTWLARGVGTAVMHGGATAIFAVMGVAMLERSAGGRWRAFLPGLVLAVVLHSAYNHFFFSPILATMGILLVLPPLALLVFDRSESTLEQWLESGFDADTSLLALINSGKFPDSRVGRYLEALRARFDGPVVADLLCYLRIRTELALRAKGILMLRESGFTAEPDPATRDVFTELEYLERSIGPTGLLAIKPFLHMSRRDLWQLYQIGR